MIKCADCGELSDSAFCPNCGASLKGKKSTFVDAVEEIIGVQFAKLWKTFRDLTWKPGETILEYCQLKKSKYLSPIAYYLLVFGLIYYLYQISGVSDWMVNDALENTRQSFSRSLGKQDLHHVDLDVLTAKARTIFSFVYSEVAQKIIYLPILLLLRSLLFRKQKPSLKDNVWFTLYNDGHKTLVLGLLFILWWTLIEELTLVSYLIIFIGLAYDTWSSKHFYGINFPTSVIRNVIIATIMFAVNVLVQIIIPFALIISASKKA